MLMVQKSQTTTGLDGAKTEYKSCDKLSTSTGEVGFLKHQEIQE